MCSAVSERRKRILGCTTNSHHRKDRAAFSVRILKHFQPSNFGNPNNSLTDPLFGHSPQTMASGLGTGGTNGGFNPLYQIGGPRSIQLVLELQF
jgi:hypothetical protein